MKYLPIDKIVFRFPLYAQNRILKILDDENLFLQTIKSDSFREAIFFASPDLYAVLDNYISNKIKGKEKKNAKMTFLKYISRMSTRCTPFGSFASCAVAKIGKDSSLIIDRAKLYYCFRYDMLYINLCAQKLQQDCNITQELRYRINSTIYELGNIVRYVFYKYTNRGKIYDIRELDSTDLLRFILKISHCYISYQDIQNRILSVYDISKEDAKLYINQLIDKKVLISEIDPFITGEDFLTFLANRLSECKSETVEYIQALRKNLTKLNEQSSFIHREAIANDIFNMINRSDLKCNKKYILQLDTVYKNLNLQISNIIIKQITTCFTMLNKITPRYENSSLSNFARRFSARYEMQRIPLLEALDYEAGIGYSTYSNFANEPLLVGLHLPIYKNSDTLFSLTSFQKKLFKKVLKHNYSKQSFLEIHDEDIEDNNVFFSDLPATMAAMCRIIDYDIINGKYILSDLHFIGSTAANLLGRFAYCQNDIESIVKTVTQNEQEIYKNDIVAEIVHTPDTRTGNILARPFIRDYEITYLTNTLLDEKHIIPVSDLMVSVENGEITLYSKHLNKRIIPRLTTAHNYHFNTTPVYQFLCDLQTQGMRNALYFSWGPIETLMDHLPRVVYKDIILCAEKWILRRSDVSDSNGNINIYKLKETLKEYEVARFVELHQGDNLLFLDLNQDICIEILAKEIRKEDKFILTEFIPCKHSSIEKTTGDDIANECIIPLIKV